MSDTEKGLSMFLPISMFLYLYFWAYLLRYPLHGMQLISVPMNLAGFVCSTLLLRNFLHEKRSAVINLPLIFVSFLTFVISSLWISTIIQALKGYELYTSYLSGTHLLETGWTFIFWFGLLTPTLYIIGIVFKDPLFFFPEDIGIIGSNSNDIRTLLSVGTSLYSLMPIIGNLAFAPLGLLLSMFNLFHVRNLRNLVSFGIGLLGSTLLIRWLLV